MFKVVWIGGSRHNIAYSTYNPPPPDRLPQCLQNTLDYMAGDGNGRVSRLLIPMMLAAEQEPPLYLSSYIEAYKQDYYDALKQAQQKLNWLPLIAFTSQAIIGTVQEFKAVRSATKALKTEWLGRRSYRKNSAALRALDVLVDCPVITATRLGKILDISAPATKTALEQLTDHWHSGGTHRVCQEPDIFSTRSHGDHQQTTRGKRAGFTGINRLNMPS